MKPPSSERSPELTAQRHLDGARQNIEFGDRLSETGDEDPIVVGWAITALFYSAVHSVRAMLLAKHKVVASSHEDVRAYERQYPELKRTNTSYRHLKQQSESARYYLNRRFTWKDYRTLRNDAVRIQKTWEPVVERELGAER